MNFQSPQLLNALKIQKYLSEDDNLQPNLTRVKSLRSNFVTIRLNDNHQQQQQQQLKNRSPIKNELPKGLTVSQPQKSPPTLSKFILFKPWFVCKLFHQFMSRNEIQLRLAHDLKIMDYFYVDRGNNSQLIRQLLQKRTWLKETTRPDDASFRWKPTSHGIDFSLLGQKQSLTKKLFNHLEGHKQITTKSRLYQNLEQYCTVSTKINIYNVQANKINIANITPKTFIVRLNEKDFQSDMTIFEGVFARCKKDTPKESLLYFFKPPDLNRGQGIQVFSDMPQLQAMVRDYVSQKSNVSRGLSTFMVQNGSKERRVLQPHLSSRSRSAKLMEKQLLECHIQASFGEVLVQTYVKDIYLINQRKFDFRIYVMCDHASNVHWFKYVILHFTQLREGYLRLSSEVFNVNSANTSQNLFMHLTNNAIQKNHSNYGKLEQGNQMGFSDFQAYLQKHGRPEVFKGSILPQMKGQILLAMKACYKKMDPLKRKYSFEIFGFDFILNKNFQMFLIEVNTNPCLEESSQMLRQLLVRMLNDAFRLTVDVLYPPQPQSRVTMRDILNDAALSQYSNLENVWEFLGCLGE